MSFEVIKNHRNLGVLPLDCGVRKYPETETQWLVVITDENGLFQCTGALITYHHMLFPASCLSKADNHKIYLSQDDCWQEKKCQSGKSFNVKDSLVIIHPQFDGSTNQNDIAIIQLNNTINRIRVQPVCLPVANKQWFESKLKIVGVNGYLAYNNDDGINTVQYDREVLKTMKEKLCKSELGADNYNNHQHFCTNSTHLEDGATVSIGLNRKQTERVVLFGLLTQAKVDGDFSLFHRITYYLSWILDNLGNKINNKKIKGNKTRCVNINIKNTFLAPTTTNYSEHPNYKFFTKPCGKVIVDNRVSFGRDTALYQFPWSALLKYQMDDKFVFKCGGNNYVMTAAHCLKKQHQHTLVAVRLGEYDLSQEIDCSDEDDPESCAPPYQDIAVDKIILNADYNDKVISPYDIGIVKLVTAFQPNKNVQPICLPFSDELRNFNYESLIISGWGATEKKIKSDILQEAMLSLVTNTECQQFYASKVVLTEKQFCASNKDNANIGNCKGTELYFTWNFNNKTKHIIHCTIGDSGGAIAGLTTEQKKLKYVQYGIVSAGLAECGTANTGFGIYTKVSTFLQWILDHVE
ncbi:unnamed protein product [Diamesa serratosioi]